MMPSRSPPRPQAPRKDSEPLVTARTCSSTNTRCRMTSMKWTAWTISITDFDVDMKCDLPELLTAQGFEDISSDFVSAPINWNGQVGVLMKNNLMNFWEACRPVVMSKLGLDEEGCTDLYIRTMQQMAKAKTYTDIPYVYGRKPINKTFQKV
ncbi:hypothetical protein BC938DRAFT_480854 [Jimgerdemannia flammicorona]|uniref:Uncharacterized protein n=1 Tax=Jimgerdemannia flammicorona TaxID=994334 RepID=A0A433QHP4_9FUNG|nr:hypothetical protein BC938DRAFT_480854 [Jimgerdemannia flammicorona]